MSDDEPGLPSDPAAERDYARPPGVDESFAPRDPEPLYTPPPPTVSPQERAEFGRPAGSNAEFAPQPGERIMPSHRVPAPPVSPGLTRDYGRPAGAEAFDPEPGSRIAPRGREPESPWWKPDARRDPWRDPRSPFWLGRPAVFAGGRPSQLAPEQDAEQGEDVAPIEEEEEELEPVAAVRGGRFGLSALVIALAVALVAGALGGGAGYWLATRAHNALHNGDIKLAKTGTPANRPPGSIADLVNRVSPAVVSLQFRTSQEVASGSGVVIDQHGYILTNNHVVEDAAAAPGTVIYVTFSDMSRATAQIVGRDPRTDLAVLKVDRSKLTVASLGDSDKLAVGDPVIAIGSPYGFRGTVTNGIVSALHRAVPEDGSDPNAAVLDAVQTDAAINPGNSGGPLVDAAGAVVGINTLIFSPSGSSSGLGFAISINEARPVAESLIHTGKVVHASIGLQTRDATTGPIDGAFVSQVNPEGPGDQAGLKTGDVITMVDTTLIESSNRLKVVILQHKPGDRVKVRYYRGNKESNATVSLGAESN